MMPYEEAQAAKAFQLVERLSNGGLGNVERPRRLGDPAVIGRGNEVGALLERDSNHTLLSLTER